MSDPPLLDWRDRKHWAWTEAPCQYCHLPTFLRDDHRQAAHKVCAEAAAGQRSERAARNYSNQF